ncbi:MAG: DUF5615 family PIN-like protein [Candidatus Njordarchaeales archaeon]
MDENISYLVVEFLKRKGYNILWIRESSYIGCDDNKIIELAKKNKSIILTLDKILEEFFNKLIYLHLSKYIR